MWAHHRSTLKLLIVLAATGLLVALVMSHVQAINGTRFHRWGWFNPRLQPLRLYPVMLLCAAPFVIAQFIYRRSGRVIAPLVLIMLTTLLLQLMPTALEEDPQHGPQWFDFARITRIVAHPWMTGYYTDALDLSRSGEQLQPWLIDYPNRLPQLHMHAFNKPPGNILWWYFFLRIIPDPATAALVGGIMLALLATLAVPMTYWLGKLVTRDDAAAVFAASYFAMIPSLVLLFPSMDQLFIVLGGAMVCTWLAAIETGRPRWSIACGIVLSVCIFFSYAMLVLGAFMALAGLVRIVRDRREIRMLVMQSICVIGTVVAIYLLMWLTTGFNTVATFAAAYRTQKWWEAEFFMPRPFPQTLPGDLQDFLLGSAWISLLLILFWLIDLRRNWNDQSLLVCLCLLQPLIVAATGLYRAETARLWGFMQPLVLIAAGVELASWSFATRMTVYLCLWALVAVMAQNIIFLY